MSELRDIENELRAALRHAEQAAGEPQDFAERLIRTTQLRAPHRVPLRLARWLPPVLAAAGVFAAVAIAVAVASLMASPRTPPISPQPTASSAQPSSPQPTASSARDWDVDGDGRPDTARLAYLGGYTKNWELVVDMTSLGRQTIRFTGSPVLPGSTDAPTIAGSVDADADGHAEIFVKVGSGASTQFWSIFKLVGRHIAQVTSNGQPARLAVGGSVTHQGGFRCDGTRFVTVNAGVARSYTIWSYERDTYTWQGSTLVFVSKQTGTTSAPGGNAPAAYSGVNCGNLPQNAPPYAAPTG
ncbi:MAG TPA: VCBS repeat-containing protein [Streptosporangiaceae bacterium]